MNTILTQKELERLARKITQEANNIPIVYVEGKSAPKSVGNYHWFRWKGRFKSYPGSYQPSTRQIQMGKDWGKNIIAPKGTKFNWDSNGLVVIRLTDKMDYHPNLSDFNSNNFRTRVKNCLSFNYNKRIEQKKNAKRLQQFEKIFKNDLKTIRVCLNDSRKAGNCVEGSLAFMERKFKINRQDILNGNYMFSFSGDKLWNSGDERAKNAVRKAWERETLISI